MPSNEKGPGGGSPSPRYRRWACYHTELYHFDDSGIELGIIGCGVGAPFAVLIAEELFACGCCFLISITSAGRLTAPDN